MRDDTVEQVSKVRSGWAAPLGRACKFTNNKLCKAMVQFLHEKKLYSPADQQGSPLGKTHLWVKTKACEFTCLSNAKPLSSASFWSCLAKSHKHAGSLAFCFAAWSSFNHFFSFNRLFSSPAHGKWLVHSRECELWMRKSTWRLGC